MYKFFYSITVALFLLSCSNKNEEPVGCVLNKLPKTVDYLKNIEKIQELHKDTIVILEKEVIGDKTYTTTLDIKENEIVAWIEIDTKGSPKNRIEIHREDYVESFLTISTKIDLQNCKLLIKTDKVVDFESGKTETKNTSISL
jgi:hypothetical protein